MRLELVRSEDTLLKIEKLWHGLSVVSLIFMNPYPIAKKSRGDTGCPAFP
jgi:hypothetical protein